jgi:hypothetical protein
MFNSESTAVVTEMECIDQPGLGNMCNFCLRVELISPKAYVTRVEKWYDSPDGD